MDVANSLLQLVSNLWGLASKPLGYICNLKDNVNSLRNVNDKLKAKSADVLAMVEREEEGGRAQRTEEARNWLGKVQEFVDGVDQVLREAEEREQIKCLSRHLPLNCQSSYKLGKRVDQMLNEARELQTKDGEFRVVTSLLPPPTVLDMPMDQPVGLDISKFNEVRKWVVNEKQVGVIGLYEMSGVGKTTFMRSIEKELSRANNRFDIVIWVVVSRPVNKDRIQDTIRRRLGIEDEHWEGWSWDERVYHLCQALTRKKFVLLLDDLWARLDLSKIGIPCLGVESGFKVVFTTRLKHVCDQMGANKTLEVRCLMPKESLKLFEKNIGKSLVDCHQEIQDLAKDIVEECKGLPLALITVGQAMAGKDSPHEWRNALTTLRNNPYKLSGMVEELYHILEFSYNSLSNPTRQACFIYCCLFPEDYHMISDDIINLWIGEGLLGDTNDDVYHMQDEGESVLGDLKRACLLESGCIGFRPYVKMHDVIRDMATWITRDREQGKNKLLVIEKEEDMSAKMISYPYGENGSKISTKHHLVVPNSKLCLRETNVRLVPRGFFNSMTARLTVLDLFGNRHIKLFPKEICNLINLCYLNLSSTAISELPMEIKNLTGLRWLLLDNTVAPFLIPTMASEGRYSRGTRVHAKSHRLIYPGVRFFLCAKNISIPEFTEKHKNSLAYHLPRPDLHPNKLLTKRQQWFLAFKEALYILLRHAQGDQDYSRSRTSARLLLLSQSRYCCGRKVWVSGLAMACSRSETSGIDHQTMQFDGENHGDGFAPEELVVSGLFSRLERLDISDLPNLTSICERTLPFPLLKSLRIAKCPRLGKLPLDSNSARGSLEEVRVEADWWAKLEWEDDAARAHFTAKVQYWGPLHDRRMIVPYA
ncbi:LOW QUALITY PROTEIN: disease resistance protein SUMM2 [Eucalyptus grandis]|uniref:LOW QUALITY PROTEIN: disease resistance protein SUMM2 n=1 Tax=Eucalyptus grandis TaxID=71139 RepID=UPI00192ED38E|nr:LOW QUALITY PROTEIN: disease resistance protein SUMM2 [Eucalyptus grandis]